MSSKVAQIGFASGAKLHIWLRPTDIWEYGNCMRVRGYGRREKVEVGQVQANIGLAPVNCLRFAREHASATMEHCVRVNHQNGQAYRVESVAYSGRYCGPSGHAKIVAAILCKLLMCRELSKRPCPKTSKIQRSQNGHAKFRKSRSQLPLRFS